jgi:osmotically inducible protein OsmC
MQVRVSSAQWQGSLKEGSGHIGLGSGAYNGPYSFGSRFESAPGTNPEELIAAAHAGCYSMFLSALLSKAGLIPTSIRTTAKVHLNDVPRIDWIELETEAEVPGLNDDDFQKYAQESKLNCPVSQALAGPEIRLRARLMP